MIRAVLALLLLIAVIAGFSGDARAHAGIADHGSASAEQPVAEATPAPANADRSPGHLPVGKCCMTAAGCGGAGSILADGPLLPVPARVATTEPPAALDAPRGLDLPVADRPPRFA